MVRAQSLLYAPVKLLGGGLLLRDHLRIYVRGGTGASGMGKYGGVGGDGGDVYLEAKKNVTLEQIVKKHPSKRFIASPGNSCRRLVLIGEKGEDLIVEVPTGVTVCTDSRREIGELNRDGDRLLVAAGGSGGSAATNYRGAKGEPHMLRLDLKLIADIGLVGFPNAGKSTFLKAVSAAKPKIASYPFTTIRPQVGMMQYDDLRQISVADLPGLIEGASENVGMGHSFLKHIERTMLLLLIVDAGGFQLKSDSVYRSPIETFYLLNRELELYKPELIQRPAVLCVNKMDSVADDDQRVSEIRDRKSYDDWLRVPNCVPQPENVLKLHDVMYISAKTGFNIKAVKQRLREIIDEVDDRRKEPHRRRMMLERHITSDTEGELQFQ